MMSSAWLEAGPHAKEIFLVQQIDNIARQVAAGVRDLKVGEVT
jgi:hypothetical protein